MERLIGGRIFYDDGTQEYDKKNLTYMLFQNLNEKMADKAKSFFRCDFRGSSFRSCHLYKNNLDRADFISTTFFDCTFSQVNIASSEFKNCYFENVNFDLNVYGNTSIQESTFTNCTFTNESFLVNMHKCTFNNCVIQDCRFERSTTEQLVFDTCSFTKVDFATMHAERHKFVACTFQEVLMGLSYFWGYLFYKVKMEDITILYRGDPVKITNESTLGCYAKNLWEEHRYYEYLNAHILSRNFDNIYKIVLGILQSAISDHLVLRRIEIVNVFDLLQFYLINGVIPYKPMTEILTILTKFDWSNFSLEERIEYMSLTEKINLLLNEGQYTIDFINSAGGESCLLTFHCQTNDFNMAYTSSENFLRDLCTQLGVPQNFDFVKKEKGSWFITFMISAAIALCIPKIISAFGGAAIEIRTKMKISSVVNKKLSKTNISTKELKEITEIVTKSGVIGNDLARVKLPSLVDFIKIETN